MNSIINYNKKNKTWKQFVVYAVQIASIFEFQNHNVLYQRIASEIEVKARGSVVIGQRQ